MGPVGGCGGGGVAVGPINQPATLAHEAGHACGLEHAPAGGAPNPDPSYPAYEPYDPADTPQASTGEYGLNVNNGNIASPQTFRDFMAYAGPSWISPYHYGLSVGQRTAQPEDRRDRRAVVEGLVWEEIRKWPPIPEPDPPFDLDLELPVFPPSRLQDVISLIVTDRARQGRRGDARGPDPGSPGAARSGGDAVHRSPAGRRERRCRGGRRVAAGDRRLRVRVWRPQQGADDLSRTGVSA